MAQYGYTSNETCASASGGSNGSYGEASYLLLGQGGVSRLSGSGLLARPRIDR